MIDEKKNIDPEIDLDEEDEEASLPAIEDEAAAGLPPGAGQDVIARHARHAPASRSRPCRG